MLKGKNKEYIVSNYILQNTNLLFKKSISDIKIQKRGGVVELMLYYKPSSKYELWDLKRDFYKEPQYISHTTKNGMLCVRFFAPSKFADLIICKLYTIDETLKENKVLNCETKNPGRS